MQSDCFIRGVHSVCQDYAIVSTGCAVLSDGCSSSPRSEVGAHLAPILAEKYGIPEISNHLRHDFFRNSVCFDTTLVYLREYVDHFLTTIIGDAIVISCAKSGIDLLDEIEYSENAPHYLSYLMDYNRELLWRSQYPTNEKILKRTSLKTGNYFFFPRNLTDPEVNSYDKNTHNAIFIASDGLKSFKDSSAQPIPLIDVVKEILSIKNYNGQFLQRRMTKMMKDFAAKGIFATDDISIAGFYWGDEA